jgi:hypothetical protein
MNIKQNKYRVKLESALWHFEHAETALHDAWNALGFLGDKDPMENKAFGLYTEAEAFAARIRAILKGPDSKTVAELRKKLTKLSIHTQK